ncbi:MAG: response regulator [Thermoanaerobaculia bacterium]|nr:response regulator [Thermoanaerobaculia bacterium]
MTSPGDTRVLVVDDDVAIRELLHELLARRGYVVEEAADGQAAWERLCEPPIPDVVLLDWSMPRLSGLDLLARVSSEERLQMMPVIMQTAHNSQQDIQAGIEAGAHYYVTKPYNPKVLESMVAAAVEDHRRHRAQQEVLVRGLGAIATLYRGHFQYRDVEQGVALAQLLARACPDPESTAVGLGELLINAVEHGNLGISYEDKTQLLSEGRWQEEVRQRLQSEEHRDKRVTVDFERTDDSLRLTIADEGPGFDWEPYLSIAPARAFDAHGRGIALANHLSFHHLEYQAPGNVVTAVIELPTSIDGNSSSEATI